MRGLPAHEGLLGGRVGGWRGGGDDSLQSVSIDKAVAADCCQDVSVPLSEGVSMDCLLVPTTWWLDFPEASQSERQKDGKCNVFYSLAWKSYTVTFVMSSW